MEGETIVEGYVNKCEGRDERICKKWLNVKGKVDESEEEVE